jgi:predicted SnoaL-like aldol condensation-catalyzing enzyme
MKFAANRGGLARMSEPPTGWSNPARLTYAWSFRRPAVAVAFLLCLLSGQVLADTAVEETNRRIAVAYYDQVFNAKNFAAASEFVVPGLVQHTALIGDGAAGLRAYIASLQKELPLSRREIKRVLTDGDTVIIQGHLVPEPGARGAVVGDILRFEEGKIVEQWGVIHPITATPHADNRNDVF